MNTMRCVVLAQEAALREQLLLLVEDQGEAWQCCPCSNASQAVRQLREGAEILLTDISGEGLIQALAERPVVQPPWCVGLNWAHPLLDGTICPEEAAHLADWLGVQEEPLPRLAKRMLPGATRLARGLLRALSMPEKLGAWRFLPDMLALAAVHPMLMQDLKGTLYPLCARLGGMTPGAVERSLRLAVEAAWSRGRLSALERFFGHSVDPERGKPTNREFLFCLQERLILALRRIHG